MNDHTEALLDVPDQFGRTQRGIFLADLLKKVDDLVGELVRFLGSTLVTRHIISPSRNLPASRFDRTKSNFPKPSRIGF
jgi:hypothetical protein